LYFVIGKLNGELPNATFNLPENVLNVSFPLTENGYSKCEYFTDNYYATNESSHEIHKCDERFWDTSKYQSSAIKTFDMVCDRSGLKPRADALFMAGVFMGSFLFGHLSDKYGRKKVFVLSLLSQLIFGLLMAFAPEFITFTIARMVS
jgi:MFS transporter, OCT family, solute carrier family 22 (organic cation transporter), member 4/5